MTLLMMKKFLDPVMALCPLVRDSCLSVIKIISKTCLPATSIAKREGQQMLTGPEENLPLTTTTNALVERVAALEAQVKGLHVFVLRLNKVKQ